MLSRAGPGLAEAQRRRGISICRCILRGQLLSELLNLLPAMQSVPVRFVTTACKARIVNKSQLHASRLHLLREHLQIGFTHVLHITLILPIAMF